MQIDYLELIQFRNFEKINLNFTNSLNIFIGENGQGKTNIIESLFLLTEGQSFRYSVNENLINLNENLSLIKSLIKNKNLEFNLKLKIEKSKKELILNEKKISVDKLELPPFILFSPESLSIIKESADERRQLVDQLITQIIKNGRRIILDYKKCLRTRNKILKDISTEKIDRNMGIQTLRSINPLFIKLATELTMHRIKALNEIAPYICQNLSQIHSEPEILFDYKYIISTKDHKFSDLQQVHETLTKRITELEIAEIQSGTSLVGPQKHDVIFLYNCNDSRFYCSQGQQRSIILAFKMAQIVYHHKVHGYYPVLLLDDVLSELDLKKQESLISALNQIQTQTFITTTDISLLSKMSMGQSKVFRISNGNVVNT